MGAKTTKAEKLEAAGDRLAAKGNYKKALEKYRQASKEDPQKRSVYEKLIEAHGRTHEQWELGDFVESLSWTMKKQELEEPAIKQVHAKLSPEWKKAMEMALKILIMQEDQNLPKMIEEFVKFGEVGTRVLIEMLRSLRKGKEDNPSPLQGGQE